MIQKLSARYQKDIAFVLALLFYFETAAYGYVAKDRFLYREDVPTNSYGATRSFTEKNGAAVATDAEHGELKSGTFEKNEPHAQNSFHFNDFNVTDSSAIDFQKEEDGGPSQPEMESFKSAGSNNMVDLFTGDFSYNIPLMDVGGYPVNIAYSSGITMDAEASWVGLGWNINPGTITRGLRGMPDDFDGKNDKITKTSSIRDNRTIGVNAGGNIELMGGSLGLGASVGVFHNSYKGWGYESGLNASLSVGNKSAGENTAGLSLGINNNSQEGITISPSLSYSINSNSAKEQTTTSGNFSIGSSYNSRSGLKGLQVSAGISQSQQDKKGRQVYDLQANDGSTTTGTTSKGGSMSSFISFASPSYNPTITLPYTSRNFTFSGKVGTEAWPLHPNLSVSGYVSTQGIDAEDRTRVLPAYGYLNYQNGASDNTALLDFNREKEIPYREKPAVPNIGIPSYTYDAFSITGEGTGGMFRAYRSDIGYIHDHYNSTKDMSASGSVDIGLGNLTHFGGDIGYTRSITQTGGWVNNNVLKDKLNFTRNSGKYEAVYFRNPGEKSINDKNYYDAIGGDDVVTVDLYQPNNSSSSISSTNFFKRYRNRNFIDRTLISNTAFQKQQREKRSQVISYLTAEQASISGLDKYIVNHDTNYFKVNTCHDPINDYPSDSGTGLFGEYFNNRDLAGNPILTDITNVDFESHNHLYPIGNNENISARWTGRMKAPVTGTYHFQTVSDDGVILAINDSVLFTNWTLHSQTPNEATLNLVAGQIYKIWVQTFNGPGGYEMRLNWKLPGQNNFAPIPASALYPPAKPESLDKNLEKRINNFRKPNHISEIDVTNTDGRRYVYGIPVYNLLQREKTFNIDPNKADKPNGVVAYTDTENSTANQKGKDWYYNSEEMPAYAHSFLLTGILSPDYQDITGDGISDDDMGDAIKFNYSKLYGADEPCKWRAPYTRSGVSNEASATYNEGLKTDNRDDKGSYIYGEKEMWLLHSIESKNMMATFVTEERNDLLQIDENGNKNYNKRLKRLKEINLYVKGEVVKQNGDVSKVTPVKTVHFEYEYELCKGVYNSTFSSSDHDYGKLTLKRIWFTYNGNNKGERNPYTFKYNAFNPSYNSKSFDRWGNYKDPANNTKNTSAFVSNTDFPYALQDSGIAARNAAAWTLDEIHLPSGGVIKASYEADDYAFVQHKRAMQMCAIAGFAKDSNYTVSPQLYERNGFSRTDKLYIFIRVPEAPINKEDAYYKYLEGVDKLYFKVSVEMPADKYGSGNETVPGYAELDKAPKSYGLVPGQPNIIWVKMKGINSSGTGDGNISPITKAALQFLRLNLPSKAYPGSEPGESFDAIGMIITMVTNVFSIVTAFQSFDGPARAKGWAMNTDTSHSWVRLDNPLFKKYGGGIRVKKVEVYDHWNAMTNGEESVYGQSYDYTTEKEVNGKKIIISSGVAAYEPMMGGEENPFHQPIEYTEKASVMAPVTMGYVEQPLGETFFPSPSVGYSKVKVSALNTKGRRSAGGYDESNFYTAYDFPTITDWSVLNDNKKKYKSPLGSIIKINSKHFLAVSQGFKVELNDMHGKLKSQGSYSETGTQISYTEKFYRVDDPRAESKHLQNELMVMTPNDSIIERAIVGKDVELMADMREQRSKTLGFNLNLNSEFFVVGFWPIFLLPIFNLVNQEENVFRSVATTKIVNRHGILDSVIHIEKGSLVSTKNMLFDSETGDVLLSRTQNEYNDPIFNFNYPAHWAYDNLGGAYKNVGIELNGIKMVNGKIDPSSLPANTFAEDYFSAGDEILVSSKPRVSNLSACTISQNDLATFPVYNTRLWVVDTNAYHNCTACLYFIDENGKPFSGDDMSVKITRPGRKNMLGASVGSITTLKSPLIPVGNTYALIFDSAKQIINAAAAEYKDFWRVEEKKKSTTTTSNNCPHGYRYSPFLNTCIKDTAVIISMIDSLCLMPKNDNEYSRCGSYYYSISNFDTVKSHFVRTQIDTANPFWHGVHPVSDCGVPILSGNFAGRSSNSQNSDDSSGNSSSNYNRFIDPSRIGPLNRSGIWSCREDTVWDRKWFGFTVPIFFPHDGYYYIGEGADNRIKISIDGTLFIKDNDDEQKNFRIWHIFPKYINAGIHQFKLEAYNDSDVHGFGVEIYDNTVSQLNAAHNYDDLNLIFSTIDLIGHISPQGQSCPPGYGLVYENGNFICAQLTPPLPDTAPLCYNPITDTTVNPYLYGVLGDWRQYKSHVYYTTRKEQNATSAKTDTRYDGTYNDFKPYWEFNANKQLGKSVTLDTTKWVWNSEQTMFNNKGFELENKDPLGRFNTGLYGYNNTLPTAVVQNSRYEEAVYEGFEDYDFTSNECNQSCPVSRHFDFSSYKTQIDSTQHHTGKYSIRVGNAVLSIAAKVRKEPDTEPFLHYENENNCLSALKDTHASKSIILPNFSPYQSQKMVFSAWTKYIESTSTCSGNYLGFVVIKTHNGTNDLYLKPTGITIDGWKKIEGFFDLDAADTLLEINLKTSDGITYYDDIRLHPYKANMKSFVYDPVTLRLVAELDENNYATFYEYDDDGTLIRVKKETERGVQTIKETRSGLLR